MSDRDRRLAGAFDALREEEARRAPPLADVLAGAAEKRRARRVARARGAAVTLLAAAVLVFALTRTVDQPPAGRLADDLMATSGLWRAPTDVLLQRRATPLWRDATSRWLRVRELARDDG